MTSNYTIREYSLRDAEYYMDQVPKTIIQKLSEEESENLKEVFASAIPKASPKLIDLRFVINLIFVRYFFVLLVGKDAYKKRKMNQNAPVSVYYPLTKLVHRFVAMLLVLIMNLLSSLIVVALAYMVVKILGFDLSLRSPIM